MKAGTGHRKIGDEGEKIAENYLLRQGYIILQKNFVYNHGEIDIIAKDGNVLVFVEVKMRRNIFFGEPEEAVTAKKQKLLRRTAEGYVQQNNILDAECRFDVVSIVMNNGRAECKLLQNCF